jgi:hypothetical protein
VKDHIASYTVLEYILSNVFYYTMVMLKYKRAARRWMLCVLYTANIKCTYKNAFLEDLCILRTSLGNCIIKVLYGMGNRELVTGNQ